jgi:GAF domain-containing protein
VEQGGSTRQPSLRSITDPRLAALPFGDLLADLAVRACELLGTSDCTIVLAEGERFGSGRADLRKLAEQSIESREVVTGPKGVAVPLLGRDDAYGAVAVHTQHLADDQLEAVHLVAGRAAVAIEHERALAAERAARARLEALQRLTDAALAHLELDALLDELLLRIRTILNADTAAILLLDEATNELVARAAKGIEEEVEAGVRIPLGRGFAGRVAADRRPIVLPDVDHADVLNPILREKGIKSLLGVPLLIEGSPIGVLHVGTLAPREFTAADVDVLQLVADRAALAIEHARAFDAERAARRRLEDVQSVTDAALAHLELEDLLEELLVRIRAILNADTAAILLLDPDRAELVARAAKGIEEEVEAGVRIPVGGGFAGRVAASRAPVILPHVDHRHVLNPILLEKGIKSLLGVPLISAGNVVGVLHVGTLRPRVFTADDVQLLQLVGERAAVAIERARVHDETVQLDALERNFVAIASHELRTPAASVYGALATLRGRELPDDVREQLEDVAWHESDRMRRLIEQLLDLSRLDAGRVRHQPQHVEVGSFLTGLVGTDPDVAIETDGDVAASLDPLLLERVVTNLVANARTYGRPPIVLHAGRDNGELKIVVEDSGEGVPLDLVPRLFDRFVRGGEGHGSGLGLSIARAYTRAHGGELRYARAGRGARFEIVLPGA